MWGTCRYFWPCSRLILTMLKPMRILWLQSSLVCIAWNPMVVKRYVSLPVTLLLLDYFPCSPPLSYLLEAKLGLGSWASLEKLRGCWLGKSSLKDSSVGNCSPLHKPSCFKSLLVVLWHHIGCKVQSIYPVARFNVGQGPRRSPQGAQSRSEALPSVSSGSGSLIPPLHNILSLSSTVQIFFFFSHGLLYWLLTLTTEIWPGRYVSLWWVTCFARS